MNVMIRRLGIVIKSIPINGDRARIGSGEECEVSLNDPYLAPVVAELVRRDGLWYIVDPGTSLEGIRRGDQRVVDELVEPGEPYVLGGFEIVSDANKASKKTNSRPPVNEYVPETMLQADSAELPGTVVQSLDSLKPARPHRGDDSKARLTFQPLPTAPMARSQPTGGPARKSRIRIILLVAAVLFGALFLLAVIVKSRSRSAPPATATTAVERPAETTTVPPPPAPPSGDDAAMALDVESAFTAWEAELARKEDAALRRKIVTGALEIGRVYAALGDRRATAYLERVIRYGEAGSAEVLAARDQLDIIRR